MQYLWRSSLPAWHGVFAFFLVCVCVLGGGCSNTLRCERAAASPTVWDGGRICERGLRKRKGLPERSGHGHRFQRPPARCHTRVVFKRSTGKRAFMWDEVVSVTATGQVWQRAAKMSKSDEKGCEYPPSCLAGSCLAGSCFASGCLALPAVALPLG